MSIKWKAVMTTLMVTLTVGISSVHAKHGLLSSIGSAYTESNRGESTIDFYTPAQRSQSFKPCLDLFPNQYTQFMTLFEESIKPTPLCSNHFAVLYSKATKTPLVVVEKLSAEIIQQAKGEPRTDNFYPDPRLKREDSASLQDYKGTREYHFDRGHQANAADSPDQLAMNQTFALSNMIPQNPTNNRKVFSKLESDVRKYVLRSKGFVFVFTGPLFNQTPPQTIGSGKVWVPTHIYKVVYDESAHRAWAYILPNTAEAQIEKPMSYDEFVKKTGLQLLPGDVALKVRG